MKHIVINFNEVVSKATEAKLREKKNKRIEKLKLCVLKYNKQPTNE